MQETKRSLAETFPGAFTGPELAAAQEIYVQQIEAFREEGRLCIRAESFLDIPAGRREELSRLTGCYFGDKLQVELEIQKTAAVSCDEEEMKNLVLEALKSSQPCCAALLQKSVWQWEGEELKIEVKPFTIPLLKAKEAGEEIIRILKTLGTEIHKVRWIPRAGAEEPEEEMPERRTDGFCPPPEPEGTPEGALPWEEDEARETMQPINDGAPKAPKEKKKDTVLCGRTITGTPRPLSQCDEEARNVIVHGILQNFSWQEIRGDKALLTLRLTDYGSILTVKAFVVLKTFKSSMESRLVKGATLMVKGSLQMDSFLQDIVLMANHITLCAEPLVVDEEKKAALEAMILGRPFQGEPVAIRDALSGVHREPVILQGDIIKSENREMRSGRVMVTIYLTDYTDSITVKAVLDQEAADAKAGDLKKGKQLRVRGVVEEDSFLHEKVLIASSIAPFKAQLRPERQDRAEEKRIELHAHTQISEMDAVVSPTDLVMQAYRWGQPAVAITDHGVVQGFPEAMDAARKCGIKVIYGVEAYLVDDLKSAVIRDKGQSFEDRCVIFDIETTGFNKEKDHIIEIGAVMVEGGRTVDTFSRFIDPGEPIPERITELTSIRDEDVRGQGKIDTVLPEFLAWAGDAVLVAHNASFDVGFITRKAEDLGLPVPQHTVVDTLELARGLLDLKRYTLDAVARHLEVSLENHHRAVDDAGATAQIFLKFADMLKEQGMTVLSQVNDFIRSKTDVKRLKAYHAVILVKNLTGLHHLYELVSLAHLNYFYRTPRIPKSEYLRLSEGLMIGSACEAGELFQAVLHEDGEEVLERLVNFYDYLEIQPIGNNEFMIDDKDLTTVNNREDLRELNRRIVALGKKYGKPVVATCDVHFKEPEDAIFRKIIMASKGYEDADRQPPLYMRTTDEMLEEFAYLGEEKAKEVVVYNTHRISEQIESILPIPDGTFAPVIEGAEEELKETVYGKAKSMYGDPLPDIVSARLERELGSIIKNGFATLYVLAKRLVWHSVADGYYVGSRGSVGSSLVATMAGITEVNPLPAHYYCKNCQYSDFDSPAVQALGGQSGFDLPDAVCPRCGTPLTKDGQEIPFEVFLGFDGDKEPDIDLNFSGEYQPCAHAYTEELFGKDHVYRAGTMGTLAEKTAYGYVKKYLDERGQVRSNAQIEYLVAGCTGIKRTTGQHPGGQIVVPKGYSIYEFCPIQHPANDQTTDTITTHFDYNQLHGRLLKLDILGHDDPTMVRMLEDLTGFKATDAPLDDPAVLSLFLSTEALGVRPEDIDSPVGTYGVPEFGTHFVRQMLVDTKPQSFSDLVRISGLSHGTDVWNNNAKDLVESGTVKISQCICTREDIMNGLIRLGMDKLQSFKIMETVRKGKKSGGLKQKDIDDMIAAGVQDWYLESCKKIQYLFPKAHAVAYVTMSLRVAYYKVHYKEAYYAAYFTIRADSFDYESMGQGVDRARNEIKKIDAKNKDDQTAKDKEMRTVLELVVEFYCRGLTFLPIDLYRSDSRKFQIVDGKLLPPFNAISGMGETAAKSIVEARENGPFVTIDDFLARTKVSRTIADTMKALGLFGDLPQSDQLSLF